MRGKILKPWDCPPLNTSILCVLRISEMDKTYTKTEFERFFTGYPVTFIHTWEKNALVEFDCHNSALKYLQENPPTKFGIYAKVQFSHIPTIERPNQALASPLLSRVICLQILRLQISLGIYDIYDECSNFGTVEKIICFEKLGKFALVQMKDKNEAALALANLSNSSRYLPNFQFKIQYSRNQDIIIQFNNAKSFDFTHPGAIAQFDQLRHTCSSESAFFTPEHSYNIPEIFDLWRPVPIDQQNSPVMKIIGFDDPKTICDSLFNLISQYGSVIKIKVFVKPTRSAIVQMATTFFAGLATTHLQNCPYGPYGRLIIQYPYYNDSSTDYDHCFMLKDYSEFMEDFELSDYGEMWPPSDTVAIVGGNVTQLKLPPRCMPIPERNVLKFPTIYEAVSFITMRPEVPAEILLKFARP